jgi:Periplasmic copper-binding protein (NosD)
MVLVDAGVYREAVVIRTERVTLRGVDRNTVILDGNDEMENGVTASANGVAVENLTVRRFAVNGVVFTKKYDDNADEQSAEEIVVKGYRASYITAYNNGLYGIYAFYARGGTIEHSYVSGHPDGGVYVGQCKPCNVVVNDIIGERNAQGFLGTNASGGVLVVNSTWRDNSVGVLVQSEDIELLAPQDGSTISGNLVENNNGENAPTYKTSSVGIAIGGGRNNEITGNVVRGHTNAGIVVTSVLTYMPEKNVIKGNDLTSNDTDLVLTPSNPVTSWLSSGNCFAENTFTVAFPLNIETELPCNNAESAKDLATDTFPLQGAVPGVDYRNVTPPTVAQPSMPDPLARPIPPDGDAVSAIEIRTLEDTKKA